MQFVVCFIFGLIIFCVSTLTLFSCLPVFSIDALMTDTGYQYYFGISCFGFISGGVFMWFAKY